ncbi:UvrD/REP helicase [Hyphomonas adhaerens MHS-3]|uniref:DNA 3'-5' helicase n=1 Tax=Hyphomonas adhaerens MHS-3 TaxID=1280949 RepID=A0A069E7D3_9PROT|nr:3'-5' exonuclease [Hyphomonas adhaerens]KCZ83532.1 UvrD/REP helicase [Hyphomonas adhaerens MHS-3]
MTETQYRVSFDVACMKALRKLPSKVMERFHDMVLKLMVDPSRSGLNIESIQGAQDPAMRSFRIDQGYRAIGYLQGGDLLLLHVDEHDKAYRWATNRTVQFNTKLNRIQILESATASEAAPAGNAAAPPERTRKGPGLFDPYTDLELTGLGIAEKQIDRIRTYETEADLEADRTFLDATSYDVLFSLAAGFSLQEIPDLILANDRLPTAKLEFAEALRTDESRQDIFVPDDEEDLRRFLNGDLEGWQVFLHPEQRRIAYHRAYKGPALVRGGAGTGKTVVAMHRAKHLADAIAKDAGRKGDKVLFTTFTSTLAQDVKANLATLCPEHLAGPDPVIEVINLDRWVGDFLKRRGFERNIVYFGEDRDRLDDIWTEVLADAILPEGLSDEFIKDEWAQIIQAKGIGTERDYFMVQRTGRGTPLDRRKRRALWTVFEAYRAKMVSEGLAEPDDAYREAIAILEKDRTRLPYSSVVVDETQDMGEPALRLIRAIVPKSGEGDRDSLFLVGDAHQRIYSRKASLLGCGIEVRGSASRLRLNYRTTELIRRYAVAVLEGVAVDDLDDDFDTLSGYRSLRRGADPIRIGYATPSKEIAALIDWLKEVPPDGNTPVSTAVLVRTNRQLSEIEAALGAAGLEVFVLRNNRPDDRITPGVRLATMHRAKGLEFDRVALALLSSEMVPPRQALSHAVDEAGRREVIEREKSLIHVAGTRARSELRVSWHGIRPDLILG